MKPEMDIYEGFKGYNAYPLIEAERIVRARILEKFSKLHEKVGCCLEKVKRQQLIKILQHVMGVMNRMERMKAEIKERSNLYVPAYLKVRVTQVDEKKLKMIDSRIAGLISKSEAIIDSLSCVETDTRIVKKFSEINDNLRNMEICCHDRSLILKKEEL